MAERYMSPDEMGRLTGIDSSLIEYRINHYKGGVDPASIRYNDQTHHITARSPGGRNLQFYVIQTSNGQTGYFAGYKDLAYLMSNAGGDAYPELGDAAIVVDF